MHKSFEHRFNFWLPAPNYFLCAPVGRDRRNPHDDRPRLLAMVEDAASMVGAHMRLIVGLGPQSTLHRGFSIVKDPDGRPITSRAAAIQKAEFTVQFHDGEVQVSNKELEGGNEP
jgi:exonuclease VII large subunit